MIILASTSKLRKLVMDASGLTYKTVAREVDERAIEEQNNGKHPEEIVTMLALAKAQAVAEDFPNDIIIAADTFGVLPDGTRLHKTNTFDETIALAMQQSGKTVRVNTGTAIVYGDKIITGLTTTDITYLPFDEPTVRGLFEVQQNERRHGGLGFFIDAPGFTLIEKIDGSYLSAMGLPMEVIRGHLDTLGYTS